jgi:hypothetical protein
MLPPMVVRPAEITHALGILGRALAEQA